MEGKSLSLLFPEDVGGGGGVGGGEGGQGGLQGWRQ